MSSGGAARLKWPAIAVVLILYVLTAKDDRHHWHEWRYLYSAASYTVDELADGVFDPGPPGERSTSEVGAWYWGQLYHQVLLGSAIRILGRGAAGTQLIQLFYGLLLPLSSLLLYLTLRKLRIGVDPLLVAAMTLLYPIGAYLGFKLLGEAPALVLSAAAVLLYTTAIGRGSGPGRTALLVGAGICLGLGLVTMVVVPLMFLGYVAALVRRSGGAMGNRRLLAQALAVVTVALAAAWLALSIFGVGLPDYFTMYRYFREFVKPMDVFGFNLALAIVPVVLFLPAAFTSGRSRELEFFALWGVVSVVPVLLLSTNYLEPRYLAGALPAFAGIVALGCERLASIVRAGGAVWITPLQGLLVAGISVSILPLMPYEMNSRDLAVIARRIWNGPGSPTILVPWNYTDYHYLRTTFPDRKVFLVQSPLDDEGRAYRDAAWEQRFRRNYGETFLPDLAALNASVAGDRVYLGHGTLPPFQHLQKLAGLSGLDLVEDAIGSMRPMNHLEQSWLWDHPSCSLEEVDREGHYEAFRVECEGPEAG